MKVEIIRIKNNRVRCRSIVKNVINRHFQHGSVCSEQVGRDVLQTTVGAYTGDSRKTREVVYMKEKQQTSPQAPAPIFSVARHKTYNLVSCLLFCKSDSGTACRGFDEISLKGCVVQKSLSDDRSERPDR